MSHEGMSPDLRIRVLKRALEILDAFKLEVQARVRAGEIRITPAYLAQARANAETELRMRRRLAALTAALQARAEAGAQRPANDPLVLGVKAHLESHPALPPVRVVIDPADAAGTSPEDAIFLRRLDDETLQVDIAKDEAGAVAEIVGRHLLGLVLDDEARPRSLVSMPAQPTVPGADTALHVFALPLEDTPDVDLPSPRRA